LRSGRLRIGWPLRTGLVMANTINEVPAGEPAWDTQQVAHYLRVSERHIRNLRGKDASFPTPRKVGNRPRWCPDSVRRWVADGGSESTGRKGGNRVR
jgi:predicted DNA-binding transcriptional regulator AlpA